MTADPALIPALVIVRRRVVGDLRGLLLGSTAQPDPMRTISPRLALVPMLGLALCLAVPPHVLAGAHGYGGAPEDRGHDDHGRAYEESHGNDEADDHHVTEAHAVRVLHAWTCKTTADTALVLAHIHTGHQH